MKFKIKVTIFYSKLKFKQLTPLRYIPSTLVEMKMFPYLKWRVYSSQYFLFILLNQITSRLQLKLETNTSRWTNLRYRILHIIIKNWIKNWKKEKIHVIIFQFFILKRVPQEYLSLFGNIYSGVFAVADNESGLRISKFKMTDLIWRHVYDFLAKPSQFYSNSLSNGYSGVFEVADYESEVKI